MAHRVHNFNPGPAALPLPALEQAQAELLDFQGSGMSVMEQSHRGKRYEAVHNEAITLVRELAGVPDDYHVLLLQGGANQQFAVIPMNLLPAGKTAEFILTGVWGEKAIEEAKNIGQTRVAATTERDKAFVRVPEDSEIHASDDAAYVHYTTNETIHGVQFHRTPKTGAAPLVADMSSDIFSRPFDVASHSLIYAGAQKNIGPSGLVLVIVKKSLVDSARKDIPKIFRYATHAANNSLYNTPPTFSIYLMRNVLRWVKDQGGTAAMAKRNQQKADALYAAIDERADFYRAPVARDSRSQMNVVFRLPSEALEERFVAEAEKQDLVGLKGHRSVGGIRVSLYNAIGPESVDALCTFMRKFG